MTAKIPWTRVAVEGAVIVLSVLLAFGIDAAWDDRQEALRERDSLAALRVELSVAAAEWAEDHGRRDYWLALTDSILAQVESPTRPNAVVNVWIQHVSMFMTRFFPPTAVMTDLVSSGNLSVLSSRDLRLALLNYQRATERLNYMEEWAREVDEDGLRPYLIEHFRWTDAEALPLLEGNRLPEDPVEPVPVPEGTVGSMLADPVFQNLILAKRHRLGIVQRRSAQIGEIITATIELIDATS